MSHPKVNKYNQQKIKIKKVVKLTADTHEITFDKLHNSNYVPGQFVSIKIDDGKDGDCHRAYSLLSSPEGNLQVCVKKVENGRGSTFLLSCQQGDLLEIMYPLGYFSLPDVLAKELIFIGTGTGIVPLLSMLESFSKDSNIKRKLIFGVRNKSALFYEDRIKKLENTHVSTIVTLSRPNDNWTGPKGRVTNFLTEINPSAQYFICGSIEMIKDVRMILNKKKVSDSNIFYEGFNG